MRTAKLFGISIALIAALCALPVNELGKTLTGRHGVPGSPNPDASPDKPASVTAPLPLVPAIIEYEYAAQYFMQWINDNAQYSMIEAIVGSGEPQIIQMILTEKKSEHRVIYCNSESKVKALTRSGEQARATKIDFKVVNRVGQQSTYGFAFVDDGGQAIRWRFIPAAPASTFGQGLSPQSDAPGLRFKYRERATTAGAGTAVQIGDKVSEAEPWLEVSAPPYFVAYRGSYVEGMQLGLFLVGSQSWRVTSAPAELIEGAKWTFVDASNETREMRVTARKADELTISETSEWGSLTLTVRAASRSLAVRSIEVTSAGHRMRVTFKPDLELDVAGAAIKAEVAFQIDEDHHDKVAQGTVIVDRQDNIVRMRWQPKTPDWAKSRSLTTTVTLDSLRYTIEAQ